MDDKDDIALMFEAELHNLDNYDGEEEYDESYEQLEALGFQLKQQLNQPSMEDDETEEDEWESLMNARKANARFAILEEAVCCTRHHRKERLQIVLRTTKRTAKGPREAKAVALVAHLLSGTHLHCQLHSLTVQRLPIWSPRSWT